MTKKSGIRDEVLSFRESVQTVVSLLSSKKIRVVDYGTKAYCAYNKTTGELEYINIPSIPDTASDALLNAIRGFIDHEVAHVLFTDQSIAKLLGGKKAFHVWNVIEDTFIERKMALMFPGSRKNLIKTQKHIIESFFAKNIKDLINACGSDTRKMFLEVFLMPVSRALCGHTPFIDFMEPYWDWFDTEMAILDSINYRTRINRITKSEGAAKLAADLIKAFRVADEKAAEEKAKKDEDKAKMPDSSKEKSKEVKPGDKDGESSDEPEPTEEKSEDKAEKTIEDDKASDEEKDERGDDFDEMDDTSSDTDSYSDDTEKDTPESDSDKPDDTPESDDDDLPDSTPDRESEEEPDSTPEESGESSDDMAEAGSDKPKGGSGKPDGDGDEPDHLDIGGDEDHDDPAETLLSDSKPDSDDSDESTDGEDGETLSESDKKELDSDDAPETLSTEDAANDMISEEIKSVGARSYTPLTRSNDFIDLLENAHDFIKKTPKKLGDGVLWNVDSGSYVFSEKKGLSLFRRYVEPRMSAKSQTLSKDLERAIASKNRVQKVNGLRRGKVNSSSLWKVAVPAINDDRVFFKKHDHKAVNAAVQLVIDLSGSMGGSRIEIAVAAAYVLSDALDRIKIPNIITGFTTAGCMNVLAPTSTSVSRIEPLFMPTLKNWNEKANSSTCMARLGLCTNSIPLANNADGESILALAHHHNGRTEDKQIMLVLSDGAPCAAGHGFSGHLVDVVDFITNKTSIDILAVGIQSSAPARFYKHHTEVDSVDDLPKTVISAIRNLLLTGKAGF